MAESPEQTFASNPDDPAASNIIGNLTDKAVHCVTFRPDGLPPDATAYRVASVDWYIGRGTSPFTGDYEFQIRRLDNGKPSAYGDNTRLIQRVTVPVTAIQQVAAGQFPPVLTVNFPSPRDVNASEDVQIVAVPQVNAPAGVIGLQSGGTRTPSAMKYYQSAARGSIWSEVTDGRCPLVAVRGTVITP